jgi:hypothetical protein
MTITILPSISIFDFFVAPYSVRYTAVHTEVVLKAKTLSLSFPESAVLSYPLNTLIPAIDSFHPYDSV